MRKEIKKKMETTLSTKRRRFLVSEAVRMTSYNFGLRLSDASKTNALQIRPLQNSPSVLS